MQFKFGKVGSLMSMLMTVGLYAIAVYFLLKLRDEFVLFPNLLIPVLLVGISYFSLKPSFLNYFILDFTKDKKLHITRPFYKVKIFEDNFQNYSVDLTQVEKVLIVIPERTYLPANYLFFMKGNNGKAALLLNFDKKEGEQIKKRLKAAKVSTAQKNVLDIPYDSMIGVRTLQ